MKCFATKFEKATNFLSPQSSELHTKMAQGESPEQNRNDGKVPSSSRNEDINHMEKNKNFAKSNYGTLNSIVGI